VRRESLRLLQTHVREIPTDDPMPSGEHQTDGPEVRLLEHERYAVLTRALATLGALPGGVDGSGRVVL
jgi:hypothetical protein